MDFLTSVSNNLKFEILEHAYYEGDEQWNFRHAKPPYNKLYIVTEADAFIENEFHRVDFQKNTAYLIPINSDYYYKCRSYIKKLYIHFSMEIIPGQDLFRDMNKCAAIPIDVSVIKVLLAKLQSNRMNDVIKGRNTLIEIIGSFFPSDIDSCLQSYVHILSKYKDIFDYIDDNCSTRLKIADISYRFGISESTLSKNFRRDMGESIKGYVNRKLVEKSKRELALTDITIKELSHKLSFYDEFHFSKFFHKHTGFSPSHYRKLYKWDKGVGLWICCLKYNNKV